MDHTGIKYPCPQCDYQATTKASLECHLAGKHSETILKCQDCDFFTKWRQIFYTHRKTHDESYQLRKMSQKEEKAPFTTILEFEVMETTFGNNDDNSVKNAIDIPKGQNPIHLLEQ